MRSSITVLILAALLRCTSIGRAEERQQNFDRDPQWDGHNNRAVTPKPQTVRQDFGYSATHHAGGARAGEIGGLTTPAAESAYYAQRIPNATFQDRLGIVTTWIDGNAQHLYFDDLNYTFRQE
ncbi:MAG: hypothetical protein ACKV0T_09930 [Planctomycetales bacterium]